MSLYREREEDRARIEAYNQRVFRQWEAKWEAGAEKRRKKAQAEELFAPEGRLRWKLALSLAGKDAVVVEVQGGRKRYEIGPGSIASGSVFYVDVERETRRELWYADGSGAVVLTVSADGVFKGDENKTRVDHIQGRTLRLDDVAIGQRLVFPKGFMHLPGNLKNARVEKLVYDKWQTIATARQQTPEYQQLFAHFNNLWQMKGNLIPARIK